jgi:acylphosphatase
MKRYCITVKGKVQGVYYRQSAAEIAIRLKINGFVRNEGNGDVYMEAEGDEEQLKKLVEWCRSGPPRAAVKDVIVQEDELKNFSGFIIHRL